MGKPPETAIADFSRTGAVSVSRSAAFKQCSMQIGGQFYETKTFHYFPQTALK